MWVRPEPVESCVRFGCQGTVWIAKPGYAPLMLLPEQSSPACLRAKGIQGTCVSTFLLSSTGEKLQNGLNRLKAFDGSVGFVGLQIVQ